MPIFKIIQTQVGESIKMKEYYVTADTQDEAIEMVESEDEPCVDESESFTSFGTFYKTEEIKKIN